MFELLLSGVFSFIQPITDHLSGSINALLGLIPGLSDIVNNVIVYLNNILLFIPLCLDFLMIPRNAVVILFDYFIVKFFIYLGVRTFKFIIVMYNKFKL